MYITYHPEHKWCNMADEQALTTEDDGTAVRTFRLPREMLARLDAEAEKDRRSANNMLIVMLALVLDDWGRARDLLTENMVYAPMPSKGGPK